MYKYYRTNGRFIFSIPSLQNSPRETNILQILNNWSGDDTLVMSNLGASDVEYV